MVLILADEDIRRCLTVDECMEAIESACHEAVAGALVEGRLDVRLRSGWMRFMPAVLRQSGVMGYKEFHLLHVKGSNPPRAEVRYVMHLFDAERGRHLAILDANYLTAIRTASSAALAARYMVPENAGIIGVIGSGTEARMQLEAMSRVLRPRRISVYSPSSERRHHFAADMGERLGMLIEPVDAPERAVEDAEMVIVATNTAGNGPALFGRWLHAGIHVSSIGSTSPAQRELDPDVWSRADRVVLDTRRALEESGDCIAALRAGTLKKEFVAELEDVVTGAVPGRTRPDETTLYKSVGRAMQDLAAAARVVEIARRNGVGKKITDFLSVKSVEPN